jgi:hypothetical protein
MTRFGAGGFASTIVRMLDWQRSDVLAVFGLLLTLVAVGAAIHTVPDERKRRALSVLLAVVVVVGILLLLAPQLANRRREADEKGVDFTATIGRTDTGTTIESTATQVASTIANSSPAGETTTSAQIAVTPEGTTAGGATAAQKKAFEDAVTVLMRAEMMKQLQEEAKKPCGPPVAQQPPLLGLDAALASSSTSTTEPASTRVAHVSDGVVVTFGNCYRTVRSVICDLDIVSVTTPSALTLQRSFARVQGERSEPAQFVVVNRLPMSGFVRDAWSSGGTVRLTPCATGRIKVWFPSLPRSTRLLDEVVLATSPNGESDLRFVNITVTVDV